MLKMILVSTFLAASLSAQADSPPFKITGSWILAMEVCKKDGKNVVAKPRAARTLTLHENPQDPSYTFYTIETPRCNEKTQGRYWLNPIRLSQATYIESNQGCTTKQIPRLGEVRLEYIDGWLSLVIDGYSDGCTEIYQRKMGKKI